MKLKHKTVIVTGSSSHIGTETAKLFASKGANVVVNAKTNTKGIEEVVNAIKKTGGKAIGIQADVASQKDVDALFEKTVKEFGTVDILINNAGRTRMFPFPEISYENLIQEFNDNFFGTVLCSQNAAKIMKKQKMGKIFNTTSVRGLPTTGREGIMPYSAAKAAVINFTKTLAKELSPTIQVNAVAPGFVITSNYDGVPEELKQEFINSGMIKRWIQPVEIAEAFLYLASADAVTGEVLVVDGGFTLKVA